jgi:hypothetical protein
VPGTCKNWGVVKNGRGGLGGLFGGEKNRHTQMASRQPKSGRQTSTRKVDGRGRRKKTTKFAACVVDSLMSTTSWDCLLSTAVHGVQVGDR